MATKPYIIALEEHYYDPEVKGHFRGLDAITFVPFWITAHARTDAPIVFGSSLIGVIAWFLICLVPTLLAGRTKAAYELPPSATNSAT